MSKNAQRLAKTTFTRENIIDNLERQLKKITKTCV